MKNVISDQRLAKQLVKILPVKNRNQKSGGSGLVTNRIPAIKSALLLLVFSMVAFINQQSFAQTQPSGNGTTIKDWQKIYDSNLELVVSYSVAKCNNVNQISLKILNKKTISRNAKFKLDVIDIKSGLRFSKELNVALLKSQELKGDCSAGALKIELPTNYDAANLYVVATF